MCVYRCLLATLAACALTHAAEQQPAAGNGANIWTHSAAFELTGKTGPVEQKRHAGYIKSTRVTKANRLKLYARYSWAETGDLKSQDEYIIGADDEINATDHSAGYFRFEEEYDDIESLRLRTTVATGISYYFLKQGEHKLRGRLGAFWRDEDYKGNDDVSATGAEAGIYNEFKNEHIGLWTTEIIYAPSLEEQRIYFIKYESKISMPLNNVAGLCTEFGIYGRYNNYTPGPAEHATTNYYARIKYTW